MTKRKKAERVYYSAEEKRYLQYLVDDRGLTYLDAIGIMARKFGRAPNVGSATRMLSRIRKAGFIDENVFNYSPEMRERAVNLARSGGCRSAREIVRVLEESGETAPHHATIVMWCRKAGVKLESISKRHRFRLHSDEARREFIRLYELGLPYSVSLPALAHLCGGRVPSKPWALSVVKAAGITRPRNISRTIDLSLVSLDGSDELSGDSWQRAWTAAEGLDGAAWADAVMREWLPDDRPHAAEDLRESRRRNRASAESRRLAA